MSRYLIDRIAALSNVELHVGCEVEAIEGDQSTGLSAAILRNPQSETKKRVPLRHMFLFIGADPNAAWIREHARTDDKGFILTGQPFRVQEAYARAPLPLETSMPNVFAIGDVRAGSTKRVAAAVGEGAAVVAQIHAALQFMNVTR